MSISPLSKQGISSHSSHIDEEAKCLLMALQSGPAGPNALLETSSTVDAEAHHLLQRLNLGASHDNFVFQNTATLSLLRIDTSGVSGADGRKGVTSFAQAKFRAIDGTRGGNAKNIHLYLKVNQKKIEARWEDGAALLELGDPFASIVLRAVGGSGGSGGIGVNGRKGKSGRDGRDARLYSSAKDGEKGERGINGSDGGDGGNGGNGGNIKLFLSSRDTDVLMLLDHLDVAGGAGGRPGEGGEGGEGGSGGKGGRGSYESECHTVSHMYTDKCPGRTEHITRTTTTFLPITRSKGLHGSQGEKGNNGRTGRLGAAGERGSFSMIVDGAPYTRLYDVLINLSKVVSAAEDRFLSFYEPGQEVCLAATVTNVGGMPTPTQGIEFSLQSADWFEPNRSSLVLSRELKAGVSYRFPQPFSFKIKERPVGEEPLHQIVSLKCQGLVLRVNKMFSRIIDQEITLAYPVQLFSFSKVIGSRDRENDLPIRLSITIKNLSHMGIGKNSPTKRRVCVMFEIKQRDANQPKEKMQQAEGFCAAKRTIKKKFELDEIPPSSERQIEYSFHISQAKQVEATALLYLDSIDRDQGMRPIQQKCIFLPSV